jgi:hypothetical protein
LPLVTARDGSSVRRGADPPSFCSSGCCASGEVLRVHSLAEGELPGERPLGPLGDNDLPAVAIVRGAPGLDRQDAVLDGHLDAVRVGAGQVGLDVVAAVLAAVDVHGQEAPGQGPWPGKPTSGSYICRRIMRGTAITMSTATMTTGPMRTMGGSLR